ncbi:hypothetical protein ACU686_02820 [Yinghuangia aomiensis]
MTRHRAHLRADPVGPADPGHEPPDHDHPPAVRVHRHRRGRRPGPRTPTTASTGPTATPAAANGSSTSRRTWPALRAAAAAPSAPCVPAPACPCVAEAWADAEREDDLLDDYSAVRMVVDGLDDQGITRLTAMRVLVLSAPARPGLTLDRVVRLLDFMADARPPGPAAPQRLRVRGRRRRHHRRGRSALDHALPQLFDAIDDEPRASDDDPIPYVLADDRDDDGGPELLAELHRRIADTIENLRAADNKASIVLGLVGVAERARHASHVPAVVAPPSRRSGWSRSRCCSRPSRRAPPGAAGSPRRTGTRPSPWSAAPRCRTPWPPNSAISTASRAASTGSSALR